MNIITDAATIAVVVGLVQVIKNLGVSSRYAPLCSVVLGVLGALLVPEASLGLTVFHGLVLGLSASGLYSGVSATVASPTI